MPWSSTLGNYYSSFGNGFVPFFAVIGANYEFLYGDNSLAPAIAAAENAIANMVSIQIVNPISNVMLDPLSSETIDISNTFQHSNGAAMTYSITGNSNPDCCSASITGSDIIVESTVVGGISQITVTATAGSITRDESFLVTVNDLFPVPVNPSYSIVFPEVVLNWEAPETLQFILGWNIYRDGVLIEEIPESQLSYFDQPGFGDFTYSIRAQYIAQESGDSQILEVSVINTIGDIDLSEMIDSYDASMILHYVANISPAAIPFPWEEWRLQRADVDGNGSIDAFDSAMILQYIVGIIDEL